MKHPFCPICQSKTTPFPIKNLPLFRCLSCQLIFQIPSKKKDFTPNEPFWGPADPRLSESTYQMKKQTFRILFKKVLSSTKDSAGGAGGKAPDSAQLSRALAGGKPATGPATNNRFALLDIGTGTGALLDVALEFGFKAIGLEPDKNFIQKKDERALKVVNSTLEKSDFKPNTFDVITMFDVLEHMRDLNSTLQKISSILKPGGLLVVSTPDTNSLSFKLMGKNWPHFKREHIYYFSNKNLSVLLSKYNLNSLPLPKSRLGGTKGGLKSLTLNYIAGYFTAFPTPILSPISHFLVHFLPKSITQLPINLPNGNMLVIAKKNF